MCSVTRCAVNDVEDYLASLPSDAAKTELTRLHGLISERVPAVGQATSYSMPCYTYRGHPVAAVIVRSAHIAWYPYSGRVITALANRLGGHSHSAGTVRFTAAAPLSDDLVAALLDARMQDIDARFGA